MEEIAKQANVSKAAVSLALNGKPGVSEETRSKILQIATEAGYIPRASNRRTQNAQGAARNFCFIACTNSGIVLEQYHKQPFFMELTHYIENECSLLGYSLFFSSVSIEQLPRHIDSLDADGIILLGTNLSPELIQSIASKHEKMVIIDACFDTSKANFVVMNNVMGAYQAAKHIIDLGHTRIGYVQSHHRMYNFEQRKKGFQEALMESNLTLSENNLYTVLPTVITSQEEFKDAIRNKGDQLPTALFCECDYIAISVIKSLTELGIAVPDDMTVVGFDNINEAMVITPELTTVHVEKQKIAELAVARLHQMVNEDDRIGVKSFVDTKLVVRKSSRAYSR